MGSTERIRDVARRVAKWSRGRAPDGRRPLRDERRDESPARDGQGSLAIDRDRCQHARARHDRLHGRAGLGRLAGARAASPRVAGDQLYRLASARADRLRLYQGPYPEHRRRARARRSRGRQGGRDHRLPGHRLPGPHHHARPRRLRHLRRRGRRRAQGRRVPDLHRCRRRLHHRSARRARGQAAAEHLVRGNDGDGEPGLQSAADPLRRIRRQIRGAAAGALQLHPLGTSIWKKKPARAR